MASTALITGGNGLIGAALLKHWTDAELEPVLVDRGTDDLLVPGTAKALIARVRPDVVIHLAWVASGTPGYRTSPDNSRWLEATIELATACTDNRVTLLATGTSLDRGSGPGDAYSSAKLALWQALSPRIAAGEIGYLRPFYVFDPAVRRPALVAQALGARDAGQPITLLTPNSRHDFVHIDDVASAVAVAASHRLGGEIEIGSGRLRSVSELVDALGVSWQAGEPPPEGTTTHAHQAANVTRLLDLGWSPTTTEELFPGD